MKKKLLIIIPVIVLAVFIIYSAIIQNLMTNVSKEKRAKLNGEYVCDGIKYVFNDMTVEAQTKLSADMKKYPYYDINFKNNNISFKTSIKEFINTNLYFDGELLSFKDLETKKIYECQKIK